MDGERRGVRKQSSGYDDSQLYDSADSDSEASELAYSNEEEEETEERCNGGAKPALSTDLKPGKTISQLVREKCHRNLPASSTWVNIPSQQTPAESADSYYEDPKDPMDYMSSIIESDEVLPRNCCWFRNSLNFGMVLIMILHHVYLAHSIYVIVALADRKDFEHMSGYYTTLIIMQSLCMVLSLAMIFLLIFGVLRPEPIFLLRASQVLAVRSAIAGAELLIQDANERADYVVLSLLGFGLVQIICITMIYGYYWRKAFKPWTLPK